MKHLQSFYENSSGEFNLELKLAKIKEKYSKEDVSKMFNNEWLNWLDETWDENYVGDEWDWYIENYPENPAQEVVLYFLIDDDDLTNEQQEKIEEELTKYYFS